MKDVMAPNEWIQMRENVRRVVGSLEICWRCQRVAECRKYILGNTVGVWLCSDCLGEMERPYQSRILNRSQMPRQILPSFPEAS